VQRPERRRVLGTSKEREKEGVGSRNACEHGKGHLGRCTERHHGAWRVWRANWRDMTGFLIDNVHDTGPAERVRKETLSRQDTMQSVQ
jgi:hypothetical protein